MKQWNEQELKYLRASWPAMSDEEIGVKLGRTATAVRIARYKNGIRADLAEWAAEDDAYIIEHWRDQTCDQIGQVISRTSHAVYQRGAALGLHKRRPNEAGKRIWTEEEHDYLRENWGHMTVGGIAKHLKRST